MNDKNMEEKMVNLDSGNHKSKWVTAVLFLLWIPPIGLYYVWKEKQFFYKKLHLLLWISGGWILSFSFIILTMWLPGVKRGFEEIGIEGGLEILSYLDVILPVIILFSIFQIIFGFIFDRKINSSSIFSEKYVAIAMIFLFITLVIAPITIIFISASANMSLHNAMLSI